MPHDARSFPILTSLRTLALMSSVCALSPSTFAAGTAAPQQPPPPPPAPLPGELHLQHARVALATRDNLLQTKAQAFPTEPALVVALARPMDRAARASLQALGVKVLSAVHQRVLLCDLRGVQPAALAKSGLVASVHRYESAWKLDPALAKSGAPMTRVDVTCFPGVTAAAAARALASIPGLRVEDSGTLGAQHSCTLTLPTAQLAALARLSQVQTIEPAAAFTTRSNSTTRWVIQSNLSGNTPLYARGLTGVGQILGVVDDPVLSTHCSFNDSNNAIGPLHRKILAYNTTLGGVLHGTHVAGTALGDAGTIGDTRGVAYGAKMVFNNLPLSIAQVYGRFDLHRSQGAFIHTNSWGNNFSTSYDGTCVAIDSFSRLYEDNLVIFAVNDGNLIKNPENAKNVLAVTASQNAPSQDSICLPDGFSGPGAGPTNDGRRKPEIAAPGCAILSASVSACSVTALNGTSMSTPAVAGIAVLMRQYFVNGFYPTGVASAPDSLVPSGALLRAGIINSGADMANVDGFPNLREGWGRVLADSTLFFSGDARRLIVRDVRNAATAALDTGEQSTFSIDVTSSAEPLKLTLAFTDVAAASGSAFPVINDLDLIVSGPDGSVYLGNFFASGQSTTGGWPDDRNSVEQVLLAAPAVGRYTITVSGAEVPQGPQGYGLVISGAVVERICNDIDFNNDTLTPDSLDLDDFLAVLGGGPSACSTGPGACDSIDFNNDGLFPDSDDLDAFLRRLSGGAC
jgi:hypothetical protein